MANQDRADKARDKAFAKANEHMATKDVYSTGEDYGWHIIWDRALRYAGRLWDEQARELNEALTKAKGDKVLMSLDLVDAQKQWLDEVTKLQAKVTFLENSQRELGSLLSTSRLAANRLRQQRDELKVAMTELAPKVHSVDLDEAIRVKNQQAGIINRQRETILEQQQELQDLRDKLAGSEARDRELRLAELRISNLSRRLNTAEAQLEEARALTTKATTTVFEENERLVAELHRLHSLVADAEELERRDYTLVKRAQEVATRPCPGRSNEHRCARRVAGGVSHGGEHRCHCGKQWVW